MLQCVTTLTARAGVMKWMLDEDASGKTKIPSRAMKKFPQHFGYHDHQSQSSCLKRSMRWFQVAKSETEARNEAENEVGGSSTIVGAHSMTETKSITRMIS